MRAWIWFLIAFWIVVILLSVGCSTTEACKWHPVSRQELNDRCEDWSGKVLGCQTGTDRCDLWVLKP